MIGRRALLATLGAFAAPFVARAQGGREVVDSAGRRVRLPPRIARVFVAGPPASVIVYSLAPETLLGWTSAFRPAELEFVPQRYGALPDIGRLTGRANTANLEFVLQSGAELVLDYGSVAPTFAALADRVQDQTGVPTLLIDGSFDAIPTAYRLLGEILGRAEAGAEFAAATRAMLDEVDAGLVRVPAARRPRVYYGRGPNGLQTGLRGSINTEIIERAGAVNVAAAVGGGLANVSLEQVLRWNPETIITVDPNFHARALHDPDWAGVEAVRRGRVYLAPALPFGWIDFPPSVNRLIGLAWLTRLFYPEVFGDDIRPRVRAFYTRFYHQEPSDAQIERLLAGAGAGRQ